MAKITINDLYGSNQGGNKPPVTKPPVTNPPTTPVTNPPANTAGNNEASVSVITGTPGRYVQPAVTAPQNSYEKQAETSIADLRNKYSQQLRSQYEYAADKMKAERDEALRENWILEQQAEAALPEQMAARGITGGAAETTLAQLKARYQGNRNDIRGDYMEELGDLSMEQNAQQAEAEKSYNDRWLEYLLSLAEKEKKNNVIG